MMDTSIFQKSVVKGMMKGKILKKLKSIKQVGYLKPDRILQVRAAEGFVDSIQKISNFVTQSPQKSSNNTEDKSLSLNLKVEKKSRGEDVQEADVIDVSELMRDLEEEEESDGMEVEDKENIKPKDSILIDEKKAAPLGEIDISSFRRPDLNSGSLFDPKLLAAFEEARRVQRLISIIAEEKLTLLRDESQSEEQEPPLKLQKTEHDDEDDDPLTKFEVKCPPGGSDTIILYTTTLHTIRKTFEDCQSIRFLLQTFKVEYFERDVSMHAEYRGEMCRVLGDEKVVPPRLFVKGRYVGGAEEVLRLHEQGKFRVLLKGVRIDEGNGMCDGCGGMRFVLCFKCSGSCRVAAAVGGGWEKCGGGCNENGLIVCPYCC
ncbi:unnamed protein product [Rhodiola kirilowii]